MEKEFLKIILDHQGIILKVCRMYAKGNDDSEDLFQEIILQLWKSYPGYKADAKISTWMYRISINTAITGLRKFGRRPLIQQLLPGHNNMADIHENRIDVEYGHELQTAINTLNKFDKALVMLYLDDKSYKDMSEIIGISESNVGVKINRIKKKLKEILKP